MFSISISYHHHQHLSIYMHIHHHPQMIPSSEDSTSVLSKKTISTHQRGTYQNASSSARIFSACAIQAHARQCETHSDEIQRIPRHAQETRSIFSDEESHQHNTERMAAMENQTRRGITIAQDNEQKQSVKLMNKKNCRKN